MVTSCGICGSLENSFVMRQDNLPIFQNALCDTQAKAIDVPRGTLNLVVCNQCGFIWNTNAQHSSEDFDPSYESDQTFSPTFSEHVDQMIARVTDDLQQETVFLEIGAGQGYFLDRLKKAAGDKFLQGYGFDKVWRGGGANDNIKLFSTYFDEHSHQMVDHDIDVVVCRHVLEYIARPVDFFKQVRQLFPEGKVGHVYFETRCTDWSLENNLSEDFCYEECAYENAANLKLALELAGFSNVAVDHVFGGQYLWAEADTISEAEEVTDYNQSDYVETAIRFGENVTAGIQKYRMQISELKEVGGVALWGASTKGITLATTIDPGGELLSCLIDMSPHKQNTFVPAAGQKIVSPQEAVQLGVRNVLVSNESYIHEIGQYIQQQQLPLSICVRNQN